MLHEKRFDHERGDAESRCRAPLSGASRFLTVLALTLALGAAASQAQINTGTISGAVTDPNAAVVPDVVVELVEQQTGVRRTAAANESGRYLFPLVPAGIYTLTAQADGFKRFERTDIQLEVNQNLTVPITLELGVVTETVSVSGAPSQVDTVSSSVHDVVDQERIQELPLNGRNVLQLQQLIPGTVFVGTGDQLAGTPAFAVNGGIGATNNYTLDGGEHTDSFYNSAQRFPNPDALQEFSVQTSTYSAEYGRNRGATVNAVTRSGTNEYHGTLFHFLRNDVLDARDFFAVSKPAFKRNQFGATLGGPVKRNRSFFFGSWESSRERGSPNTVRFRTYSQAMRQGDYSELGKDILDPLSGEPFPNAVIPESRRSVPADNFLSEFVPLPNQPNSFFSADRNEKKDVDQFLGRFDHQFSDKDSFYARYIFSQDNLALNQGDFPFWFSFVNFDRQSLTSNYTRTFSPTLLNSFTFTFNRVVHIYDVDPEFSWNDLGANIPDTVEDQKGWLVLAIPGFFTAQNGLPWDVRRNTYNIANTTTWIKGNHTIKFGGQVSRYATSQFFEFLSAGATVFSGQFTGDPATDFAIGRLASFRQDSPGQNELRQNLWGFFVADDFRVHPRLTLNLGLRYEPYFGFRELNGQAAGFRPGRQSTVLPNAPEGLLFQGDPGIEDNFFKEDWNNFAPRFGFAWDVFGNQKMAVRGGYGIFYDSVAGIQLNRFPLNQPFLIDVVVQDRPLEDPFLGNSPFPFTPPQTEEERQAYEFVVPANMTSANEDLVTPYTQQWNFTLEFQMPAEFTVSAAYVGSKSSKLFGAGNLNPAIYEPGATTANTQERRLYPQFTFIENEHTVGYSQYHSLQLRARRRFSEGFSFQTSYTVGKNTGFTGPQGAGGIGTRDPLNHQLDDSVLPFDVTHVWSTSYVWELPSPFERGIGRQVLGGWQTTGILQIQTGFPFTVRSGVDNSKNGQFLDTADLVGDPFLTDGSRGDKVAKWFNTDAFTFNEAGTVGNVGINTMRGPGLWTFDVGLYKNVRWGERYEVQFRTEFFNLMNNPNFDNPIATVASGAFGQIFSTRTAGFGVPVGPPRVIEFGLKFRF